MFKSILAKCQELHVIEKLCGFILCFPFCGTAAWKAILWISQSRVQDRWGHRSWHGWRYSQPFMLWFVLLCFSFAAFSGHLVCKNHIFAACFEHFMCKNQLFRIFQLSLGILYAQNQLFSRPVVELLNWLYQRTSRMHIFFWDGPTLQGNRQKRLADSSVTASEPRPSRPGPKDANLGFVKIFIQISKFFNIWICWIITDETILKYALLLGGGGPACRFRAIFWGVGPPQWSTVWKSGSPQCSIIWKSDTHKKIIATYKKPPLIFYKRARLDPPFSL